MARTRLLDLFAGAGGAAMGYYRAGFTEIVGVDIVPQPRYPFEFVQADALEFLKSVQPGDFTHAHASPPCQRYTRLGALRHEHWDSIPPVQAALRELGIPYVIENVEDARHLLREPVRLCGTMFGLNIWRHRYFEVSEPIYALTSPCQHGRTPVLVSGTCRRKGQPRKENSTAEIREAIGIPWMTKTELDQAIPHVYTEWLGRQLLTQ